jgi:hypothetical protein
VRRLALDLKLKRKLLRPVESELVLCGRVEGRKALQKGKTAEES